jgi:DNA-binding XRE family transcriptional regulator
MTIRFEKLKARLLANPKVKAEYDALAPEFEIAAELLRARLRAGLSQAELATRMGTSQSTIARLENGHTLPSTKTLLRYAERPAASFRCGCRRRKAVVRATSSRGASTAPNAALTRCHAESVVR